jgi:hypothetical protein
MFDHLVALMWQELKVVQTTGYNKKEELPQWL